MDPTVVQARLNEADPQRWVAALRSGNYTHKQGTLGYRASFDSTFEACCLGVLCDVADVCEWQNGYDRDGLLGVYEEGHDDEPTLATASFGDTIRPSWMSKRNMDHLIKLNDASYTDNYERQAVYIERVIIGGEIPGHVFHVLAQRHWRWLVSSKNSAQAESDDEGGPF